MAGGVIDASVAVKWFLEEDRSTEARALIGAVEDVHAPAIVVVEVTHALLTAVRQGRTSANAPEDAISMLLNVFPRLTPDLDLVADAARLSRSLQHPIYDCLYLALGRVLALPVITADERLYAAGRKARVPVQLL